MNQKFSQILYLAQQYGKKNFPLVVLIERSFWYFNLVQRIKNIAVVDVKTVFMKELL